jgi:uracil-DNA glycosylase family 4
LALKRVSAAPGKGSDDAHMTALSFAQWEEAVRSCTSCQLHETRTNAVTCSGPTPALMFFLGEAPGQAEDETGAPFQGRSGQLLNDCLQAAGTTRDLVHVGNAVRCRPPANRPPHPVELNACASHLDRELDLVRPKVIVTLGASALRSLGLLERGATLSSARGELLEYRGRTVLPTVHPAYVLRNRPGHEPGFINDLKKATQLAALYQQA